MWDNLLDRFKTLAYTLGMGKLYCVYRFDSVTENTRKLLNIFEQLIKVKAERMSIDESCPLVDKKAYFKQILERKIQALQGMVSDFGTGPGYSQGSRLFNFCLLMSYLLVLMDGGAAGLDTSLPRCRVRYLFFTSYGLALATTCMSASSPQIGGESTQVTSRVTRREFDYSY